MINKKLIKTAYTMAEILIVMAIFSVVMSLLIRSITRVDPDKHKILFIKSYHATEEIFAQSINDATIYDQNIYSRSDIANWEGEKHFNFEDAPLQDAKIIYVDNGVQKTACKTGCDSTLSKNNAPCYYIARFINTLGTVSCSGEDKEEFNLRSSVGVCYYNWSAKKISGAQNYFDAVIDPSCTRDSKNKNGIAIRVYKSGAIEVPESSDMTSDENQARAIQWLKSPSTVDD